MKISINKKATSIVEAMIIMLIVVSGVTGMYNIFIKSTNLSTSTTNKIQAIQIATQGIEGITNIRDTNWLLFSSDYNNCWNSLNYNAECIGSTNASNKIADDGNYIIYRDSSNRWVLSRSPLHDNYINSAYRDFFKVGLDGDGIYTQTGVINNLRPLFTREININYLNVDGTTGDELSPKMHISSIVNWIDNTSTVPHKVVLEQVLSNWKK